MYYTICPYCGAHLDPGERCDCQNAAAAILNVLAESNTASMASSELRAAVIQETGCSQRTYERAYRSLIESGEIAKFQLNQPGGIRGWFTRLCYQSEADGEVTE